MTKLRARLQTGLPLWRGERDKGDKPYASDPGDLGRGRYYTTSLPRAKCYGTVRREVVRLTNPLVLPAEEAYKLADQFGTINLTDEQYLAVRDREERRALLLANAQRLTDHLVAQGHDGLASVRRGEVEVVCYKAVQA